MNKLLHTFREVIVAVVPILVIILIVLMATHGFDAQMKVRLLVGTIFVAAGITLFLFGIEFSILQVGSLAGSYLIKRGKLVLAIGGAFVIGTAIAATDPDIHILVHHLMDASGDELPQTMLFVFICIGVGMSLVVAVISIILRKNLISAILIGYGVIFLLALIFVPEHSVPMAFDAGAVVTGPIVVPFMLAFSIGMMRVIGNRKKSSGFGMVAIASLGPNLAILIMGILVHGG